MSQGPKPGDRVRVTTRDFEPDYRWGDTGLVESGPHPLPSGGFYCIVTMEKDGAAASAIIFNANDIEVDLAAIGRA